jgi:hypothetical protein
MPSSARPRVITRPDLFLASLVYFSLVFVGGCACGVVRIPLLLPIMGVRYAELLEIPVMALLIWKAALFVVKRFSNRQNRSRNIFPSKNGFPSWLAVGVLGLMLLLSLELLICANVGGMKRIKEFFVDRDPITGPMFFLALGFMGIAPWCVDHIKD